MPGSQLEYGYNALSSNHAFGSERRLTILFTVVFVAHSRPSRSIRVHTSHVIVIVVVSNLSHDPVHIRNHLVLDLHFLVPEVRLDRLMFLLVERRECVFWARFGDKFEIESSSRARAEVHAHSREYDLVYVGQLDEGGLFRHEEDIFLKEEKIALDSFQVGFDTGEAGMAEDID